MSSIPKDTVRFSSASQCMCGLNGQNTSEDRMNTEHNRNPKLSPAAGRMHDTEHQTLTLSGERNVLLTTPMLRSRLPRSQLAEICPFVHFQTLNFVRFFKKIR